MSSPEFRLTNASNVVYSVLLPALQEMSRSGTTEVTTATSILMLTLLRALLATLELQQWEVKNTVWFGFLNLSWILHQQTLCILDPKLSIQRWGKKVSFSQWWCCMTSSSSHLPILHWKIKVFKCQHISGVLGAVPKSSTHIGWGGAWGQGYNWCCDVCVWCSRGKPPTLPVQGSELWLPWVTHTCFHGRHHNYTTIAQSQSLLERPHAWHASSSHSAGLNSIHFSALYSQLPCRRCVQTREPAQTRRLPAARIIKPGSLGRPCGSSCSVLQQTNSEPNQW